MIPLFLKVKIKGRSMEPTLKHNETVIVSSIPLFFRKPKVRDIVILQHGRCIIKRIAKVKKDKIFIVGDNKKESTDSSNFGWVSKRAILGKVICRLSS